MRCSLLSTATRTTALRPVRPLVIFRFTTFLCLCSGAPILTARLFACLRYPSNLDRESHMQLYSMSEDELEPEARDFYRRSLLALGDAGVPYLVGGAYALHRYTGIER